MQGAGLADKYNGLYCVCHLLIHDPRLIRLISPFSFSPFWAASQPWRCLDQRILLVYFHYLRNYRGCNGSLVNGIFNRSNPIFTPA